MGIKMLRQNRWVALLVGALFVSLSLISLLGMQTKESQGEKEQHTQHNVAAAMPKAEEVNHAGQWIIENHEKILSSFLTSNQFQEWKVKEDMMLSFPESGLKEKQFAVNTASQTSKSKSEAEAKSVPVKKDKPKTKQAKPKKKQEGTTAVNSQAKSLQPPTTLFFTRTETLTQAEKEKATWEYALSAEELLLLQKIVMAEAEGEPYEGKVAVANVVLNRLRSANFPDTITDVIYQKHQFSPVGNGRLERVHPNEETVQAVNAALHGDKAVSDDTYFFLSLQLAQDLTVHHSRTFVKKIGNHSFYK
ncbi:cell wall hydrolase [Paenibacillus faecalis]|uniref:cell wall hydrolase n=1 Tax=Paenibacillus faecalis TaxID=2079532 RepID=UPI000D0F13D1|nr:cell wall hydrolase [Paenibacillus faecalis]